MRHQNPKAFSTSHSRGTPFDHYESITGKSPARSKFNLSHSVITSYNCGKLVPITVREILPGDSIKMSIEEVTRLVSPLVAPVLGDLHITYDAFFVPNRVALNSVVTQLPTASTVPQAVGIGNIWKQFMGENMLGTNATDAFVPTVRNLRLPYFAAPSGENTQRFVTEGSILDYCLNLPRNFGFRSNPQTVFCTAAFGYLDIWNYWYRDQNTMPFKHKLVIQSPVSSSTPSWIVEIGDLSTTPQNVYANQVYWNSDLLPVCKKHDYFTSGLPLSWKPLQSSGSSIILPDWLNGTSTLEGFTSIPAVASEMVLRNVNAATGQVGVSSVPVTLPQIIRAAFALQLYLENNVRFGSRLSENIYSHFKVRVGEYQLDYPEFLGSYHTRLGLCQIPQTSSSDAESPQGNLSAFGMVSDNGFLFDKTFTEHGHLYVLANVRVRQIYQQGVEKFYTRGHSPLDYYSPEFRHLNMQPIRRSEIYSPSVNPAAPPPVDDVFCWSDSWQDYRAWFSRVTGQARSNSGINDGTSLDYWHYGAVFLQAPIYGAGFLVDNTQSLLDRCLAVTSSVHHQIISEVRFNVEAYRELPMDGTPHLVDHL